MDQRMLADEILDFGLGASVERVVGGTHVGEFGVRTPRGKNPAREQRVLRRNWAERAVGVPQPVAELEEPHPVAVRHDVAVLVEVGKIGDARAQPLILPFSYVPRRPVALEFAKVAGKSDLLLVGDVLVAKNQHRVFVHPCFDRGDVLGAEGPATNDARDLADEDWVDLTDRDGHLTLAPSLCARAQVRSEGAVLPDEMRQTSGALMKDRPL